LRVGKVIAKKAVCSFFGSPCTLRISTDGVTGVVARCAAETEEAACHNSQSAITTRRLTRQCKLQLVRLGMPGVDWISHGLFWCGSCV